MKNIKNLKYIKTGNLDNIIYKNKNRILVY